MLSRESVSCRAHPLTRILRPAISGTAHCVTLPEPPHLHVQPAATGEMFRARNRAATLRSFLASLLAHSPRRDTARLDMQSDVVKWMQLENLSLKGELRAARDKASMLQKFVASRGAQEVKTWELWRELETMRASAAELRTEADTLQAALQGARSTVAAAEAAAEAAGERAAAEASMHACARREAASAAARAAAMEAAVDRMAKQLADTSAGGSHPAVLSAVQPPPELNEGSCRSDAFDADAAACVIGAAVPAVSVTLAVADGTVQVKMHLRATLVADAADPDVVLSAAALNGSSLQVQAAHVPGAGAVAACTGDAESVAAGAGCQGLPGAALALLGTLRAALASSSQRHKMRCEQAHRAAVGSGHGGVADSTVVSLLTLLARTLTPLAAPPSIASGSLHPLSTGGGVTPVASACSLDLALTAQQLASPWTPSHGVPRSLASASEASPRPQDCTAAPFRYADQSPSPRSTLEPLSAQTGPMLASAGCLAADASRAAVLQPQRGTDAAGSVLQSPARLVTSQFAGMPHQLSVEASPVAPPAEDGHADEGQAHAQFQGLRTAWPGDLAVAPAEWISALLSVLCLPRVIEEQIRSLDSQACLSPPVCVRALL